MFGDGRRPAFITYMLGAAIMVFVYSKLADPAALLIGGAIMGLFVNGMLGGYGALMSELYPTAARATAQNVLFTPGRADGGRGPAAVRPGPNSAAAGPGGPVCGRCPPREEAAAPPGPRRRSR